MNDLLSVSEAREKLLAAIEPVEVQRVSLDQAEGRVLAGNITAPFPFPHFANSSMDGFAVRADDVQHAIDGHPVVLRVIADIPAGSADEVTIGPGEAARIMTGAPLPPGAEAVIPVENTDFNYRQPGLPAPELVQIFRPATVGENIRPAGQDVRAGELVLNARQRLTSIHIAFLAMLGITTVPVYRRPKVAVISSGDELVPVGETLQPGKIYDSNSILLAGLIRECGCQVVDLGIAADREQSVLERLEAARKGGVDLIISSAGVSVGAFDFIRTVVEQNGSLQFWRVNMRPGKPLAFGQYREILFIGLPGNPVSAFVGFEVFIRPALIKMSGLVELERLHVRVKLSEPVESDGRESYLRAIVTAGESGLSARLTGHQGSGNMRSLIQSNALLIVRSGVKSLPAGAETDAWILNNHFPGVLPGSVKKH